MGETGRGGGLGGGGGGRERKGNSPEGMGKQGNAGSTSWGAGRVRGKKNGSLAVLGAEGQAPGVSGGLRVNLGLGLGECSSGGQLPGSSKHGWVCHLEGPNVTLTHGFRPQLQAHQVGTVGGNARLPPQLQSCQHLQQDTCLLREHLPA